MFKSDVVEREKLSKAEGRMEVAVQKNRISAIQGGRARTSRLRVWRILPWGLCQIIDIMAYLEEKQNTRLVILMD